MGKFFDTVKAAVVDFIDDECLSSGASLAYYTIFALPPLLVLVFFLAGLFGVSNQKVQEVVSRQVGIPIPEQPASDGPHAKPASDGPDLAKSESEQASGQQATAGGGTTAGGGAAAIAQRTQSGIQPMNALGPVSKVVGVVILIFSATGLFAQLQTALNKAWEVEPDPARGWTNFLMKRVLSLGMVIVIAFLLLVSLVLTTLVDEIVMWTVGQSAGPVGTAIGMLLNTSITLVMATLLFAAMYKLLPDATMRWRDLWAGSFITAILFVIGKELIGWYLRQSDIGSAWGSAAASMVAFLVWVYYSSLIVLLGAELTQVWAKNYGYGIQPEEGAVRVVHEKKHIRGAQAS